MGCVTDPQSATGALSRSRVTPAHVAFFSGAAHGHVNPMLGIVSELVRRGHRVTYATTEHFAPQIVAAGATPVLYRSALPSDPGAWPKDMRDVPLLFLQEAIATLPELEIAYKNDRPDIVLSEDPAGAGRILAAKWGIQTLQVWPYLADERHWAMGERTDPAAARFLATLGELLRSQGLGMSAQEHLADQTDGGIILMPRGFHRHDDEFPAGFAFVGPCLSDRSYQGNWQPRGDGPVLLISLGSINNHHPRFYRMCIEAFADAPWDVVMSVGSSVAPSSLGTVPSNFTVRPQVPQLAVLSRASAFITHAGMGSIMEALYHAVPLVAIPQLPEQAANALRVAELGLGRLLPRSRVTPGALLDMVSKVTTNQPMLRRTRAMQKEIRGAGGAPAAAAAVEARLAPRLSSQ